MNLLLSRFETYLLDEEPKEFNHQEEQVQVAEQQEQKQEYPQGFFSSL